MSNTKQKNQQANPANDKSNNETNKRPNTSHILGLVIIASVLVTFLTNSKGASINYLVFLLEVAAVTIGLAIAYKGGKVIESILKINAKEKAWQYWVTLIAACVVVSILAMMIVGGTKTSGGIDAKIEQYYEQNIAGGEN